MKFEKSLHLLCELKNAIAAYIVELNCGGSTINHCYKTGGSDSSEFTDFENTLSSVTKESIELLDKENSFITLSGKHNKKLIIETDKILGDENSSYYIISLELTKKGENAKEAAIVKELIAEQIREDTIVFKDYVETTANINTVIYSTNADGSQYYFISENVERIFGFNPKEINNNRIGLIRKILPKYFAGYKKFIKDLKEGKKSVYEYAIKNNEGKKRYIRHFGNPISINEKVVRVVGIIDDITEEKTTLERLERSEEKFRLFVETANDFIISLNGFGYVSLVNKNGAKLLGFTPDEILGMHFLELIDESAKSDITDAFQKILSGKEGNKFEAVLIDKFDKPMTFDFHATPIIDNDIISGMLAIGRDITTRRKNEETVNELNLKLSEANRLIAIERDRAKEQLTILEEVNRLKNDFVSRVSHEFRTPLASIVGFAETIVSDDDLPTNMVSEFSNIILTEGKRLAKLVNDVLDFSKLEEERVEIEFSECNVIEILTSLAESFSRQAQEKKIVFSSEIPEADIKVNADYEMLKKSFACVIENAIKYTKPEGRVTVIIQDFLKEVEIIVSDTGVGIPEKEFPKLFEKFSRVDNSEMPVEGVGLGLAYVKQVIDLHKGLVKVKSEVDKGSTFIIRLPKNKN